jgi:acyl carrier protein
MKMTQNQALNAINDALRKTLKRDDVTVTMKNDLRGDDILDSLDAMVFFLELSEHTDKKFPEKDLVEQGFYKVAKIVEFLTT